MKAPELIVCGCCVQGFHTSCPVGRGGWSAECACEQDFHRPSRRVREYIADSMHPDPAGRERVVGLIEQRDCHGDALDLVTQATGGAGS